MSSTYTIRLPEKLREKMSKVDTNWGEEIRAFIEERVRCLELVEVIEEMRERAERRRLTVDSTSLIREDRER
ncbi:MAG TPA: VapB-type antitoxin [Candidatus Bathyarchaeia archaeon]